MNQKDFKRYTVTAALPYTNGPVHIGHLAGVYIPADIYVRYLRAQQRDVIFVCGSDEHGVPITIKAKKENCTPQQLVDKYHRIIGDSMRDLGVSFDIYHRTSSDTHHQTAQEFFTTLFEKGIFEEETTEQYYDESAKQFLADRYITGTCPKCSNENAYGDQCEKCGSTLNPTDLINPKSTLSGEQPVLKSTKNWFLPLDKLSPQIEAYINQHSNWKPNVFGQCQSWIKGGLQPRAMTRDLDWGVKVPIKDAEGKVLYVWFDAPIGYISATKDLFNKNLTSEKQQEYYIKNGVKNGSWEPYWKSDDTKLVHFIGKDNIVFHCVIFPAMLMSHGDYTLAAEVPANEFLNLEGDKISTSRNWAVWLNEYLQEFEEKQDILRYVLTATAPETKDNDFTWKDFQARNNNELVAVLGNFVNRVTVLTQKYFEGNIPARHDLTADDEQVLGDLAAFPDKIAQSIEAYRFREALSEVMNLARLGNKYLADTEPWKLIKTDENRVQTILNIGLQIAASLRIVLAPFMPFTAAKLAEALVLPEADWKKAGAADLLVAGSKITVPTLLFDKIEDEAIVAQIQKLERSKAANAKEKAEFPPIAEEIQYEQFASLDIRVGAIIAAEKVAKTKKLLKLTVDIGVEQRTVVSGIAEYYQPEDIIGQQVSLLANLAPKELKGIPSQGMILMAEDGDGQLRFVAPSAVVSNGAVIK